MSDKVVDARGLARRIQRRALADGASDIDRLDDDAAVELEQWYLRCAGLDRRVELEELWRLAAKIDELVNKRLTGLEERDPGSLRERSYAAVPEPSWDGEAEGERSAGEHLRGLRRLLLGGAGHCGRGDLLGIGGDLGTLGVLVGDLDD